MEIREGMVIVRVSKSLDPEFDDTVEVFKVVGVDHNILKLKFVRMMSWGYFLYKNENEKDYLIWNNYIDNNYIIIITTKEK